MIDVHVLTLPETNTIWFDELLESLRFEPIKLHIIDGIKGNLGLARTKGFQLGDCKYVSYVDHDDLVIPGIFRKVLDCLDNTACSGVYTDEVLMNEFGKVFALGWSIDHRPFMSDKRLQICNIGGQYMHHLIVLKREYVEKCLPLQSKMLPEPELLNKMLEFGPLVHLREIGYKWRIHKDNGYKEIRCHTNVNITTNSN
jgi:hypothetical protein